MKKQTGDTYQSSAWAKALLCSEAKVGKSCFVIASALGVLPWQKKGGIVDKPENLHVLTFDANALGGIKRFLIETCGAPKEALNFNVYNLQEDMRQVCVSTDDWNSDFFNAIMSVLQDIAGKARGVPVLHISSLTGVAQGLERALAGPPGGKKGAGMDMAKWAAFSHQLSELRNYGQLDKWHAIWEAHIQKLVRKGQQGETTEESLSISGKTGQNFAYNVEQVFRIRRMFGQTYTAKDGTKYACDKTFLDTRPAMEFIANGRNFTEALDAQEYCMTSAFQKLGLSVGGWGAKSSLPKKVNPDGK